MFPEARKMNLWKEQAEVVRYLDFKNFIDAMSMNC
jgi:hypothetical protein